MEAHIPRLGTPNKFGKAALQNRCDWIDDVGERILEVASAGEAMSISPMRPPP
jgi:hypothetical protein